MSFSPPTLDVRSPLLETGLADDRFHVTDYLGDGAYPARRAEKDKAERYVAYVVAAMDRGDANATAHHLRAMFRVGRARPVERRSLDRFERQVRFAALQRGVDDALYRRPSLPMLRKGSLVRVR
jgi:hypothetical protein